MKLDTASAELMRRSGGTVRGYIPQAEPGGKVRLVHWSKAARTSHKRPDGSFTPERWNPRVFIQNVPVPESVQQDMLADLPAERRRSARERYDALVGQLLKDMRAVKAILGRAVVPASIAEQIRRAAWTEGTPDLLSRIEQAEPEAVEVYAGFLMRDVANKQKEKDQHKTALDWSGHYNA